MEAKDFLDHSGWLAGESGECAVGNHKDGYGLTFVDGRSELSFGEKLVES